MISRTVFSRNTSLTPTNQKAKLAILCASVCVLSMLTPPGASAQTCAAPAAGAVNLCSPVTGAPISNASNPDLTVTAKATAPPGKTIAQTQAFIDGVAKTVQTGGTYSAMYNLPLGSHTVFVQAKTNTGTLINSPTVSIVIASGSYSAFTGTNYVAQPTPPAVGPGSAPWYTGTGMIVTDTFGTFVKQIARVTDANTHSNQSFQTAEEGNRTLWNKDSTFLLIANNAGGEVRGSVQSGHSRGGQSWRALWGQRDI